MGINGFNVRIYEYDTATHTAKRVLWPPPKPTPPPGTTGVIHPNTRKALRHAPRNA